MHAHKSANAGKKLGLAATPSTQASPRCALEPDAFAYGKLDTVIGKNTLTFSPSSIVCTYCGRFSLSKWTEAGDGEWCLGFLSPRFSWFLRF